jgi:hypothetical protein
MVMLRRRTLVSCGVEAVPVVQEVLLDRHMVCCASRAHMYGTLGWVCVCWIQIGTRRSISLSSV